MEEYKVEEYEAAEKIVASYEARAIEVLKHCGDVTALRHFNACEQTFISVHEDEGGQRKVVVTMLMGDECIPGQHFFRFPWELMNTPDEDISKAYSKWRKEEDARLAEKRRLKEEHWAQVRNKYLNSHYGIEIMLKKEGAPERRMSFFDLVTVGMKPCVDACIEAAEVMSDNIKRKTLSGVTFIWENGWEVTLSALETNVPPNNDVPTAEEVAKGIERVLMNKIAD